MGTPRIDIRGFINWLQSQPPNKQIGVSKSQNNCPLSRYLMSQGSINPVVTRQGYTPDDWGNEMKRLPNWAPRFLRRIDRSFTAESRVITAEEALRIVTEVRDDMERAKGR